MELAAVPLVLFLDEPTSGLDSASALTVAEILRQISKIGVTVVAVIHQPRWEIFAKFDDLLMIAPGGLTAYLGESKAAKSYFERLGFEFDPESNQADILMDILAGKGSNPKGEFNPTQLAEIWAKKVEKHLNLSRTLGGSNENESKGLILRKPSSTPTNASGIEFIQQLTLLTKARGARFYWQLHYCHLRALIQQTRRPFTLFLEIGIGCFTGLLLGVSLAGANGELYNGLYVQPYTLLSPAPLEYLIPLLGLMMGVIIALAGASAGVKIFSEEKQVFIRESAVGHSPSAYYIGKIFGSIPRIMLSALHFASLYMFLARPQIEFGILYLIILFQFWGVYGLSTIISVLVKRENGSLMAVILSLVAAIFCGYGPPLHDAKKWGILFIWEISFNKWATEAMLNESYAPYKDVFDIEKSAANGLWTLGQTSKDIGMMFLLGFIHRIIGFVLMVYLPSTREKLKQFKMRFNRKSKHV